MERAGSILMPAIKRLGIEEDVRLQRIKNDWDTIFNEPLSLHMSPSRLLEGELLLNTDSPIWMQQLNFCRKEILGKLAAYGVREIRLRVGKVFRQRNEDPDTGRQVPRSVSNEDALFIDGLVAAVSDEELKTAIRNAAENFLSVRIKK
ncbi:MAG: hypothetical protein C0402_04940 [Thermodesulfovibrio sp.]|nr:hypothetical protein [Thermodesulfovibrio sp.]